MYHLWYFFIGSLVGVLRSVVSQGQTRKEKRNCTNLIAIDTYIHLRALFSTNWCILTFEIKGGGQKCLRL